MAPWAAAATPASLQCNATGTTLVGAGTGSLGGHIVSAVTNELISVATCTFVLGRPGYETELSSLVADGDPTSSYLIVYGELTP